MVSGPGYSFADTNVLPTRETEVYDDVGFWGM